jgi:membrane-bound serine protease (ClpP class)
MTNCRNHPVGRKVRLLFPGLWFLFLVLGSGLQAADVDVIRVDGPITPVTAKYIHDGVRRAEKNGSECLVIQMDTPGGLMQSTWSIDKLLLSEKVPVVIYISPSGGRAASAGVYITYAAHVAAMAPSTNIGSAHPVTMGGQDSAKVMTEKITNDAVAHIKGLAEKRKRNAVWAEEAVRKSVSITEKEALALGVIDLVAEDIDDLLQKLDGMTIRFRGEDRVLATKDSKVREFPMDWQYKILDKISDPNIAYILLMLGIYGLFFELSNPGTVLPGVVGGIFLLLAFFALQVLSFNSAGLLLILLSLILFLLEIKITSYGLLTVGGAVSMLLGSLMLFKTPDLRVSLGVILPTLILTVLFFVFVIGMTVRSHRKKATTGVQGMINEEGVALSALSPEGQVSVHGEVWRAVAAEPIKKGERIMVKNVRGLIVDVARKK